MYNDPDGTAKDTKILSQEILSKIAGIDSGDTIDNIYFDLVYKVNQEIEKQRQNKQKKAFNELTKKIKNELPDDDSH